MGDQTVVITDTGEFDPGPAVELLTDSGFTVDVLGTTERSRIAAEAHRAVVLVVHDARIDASLLDQLPQLRLIVTMNPDYCDIDTEDAERRGVWVAQIPAGMDVEQIANHAIALSLAQLRRVASSSHPMTMGGGRPCDLTLGVVGMGAVGSRVAELSRPLFGRVVGTDARTRLWPQGVDRVGFAELIAISDVISLHMPLTPRTRGMIDAQTISWMRQGVILVNLSANDLISRPDLITALHTGKIAGLAANSVPEWERHASARCPLRSHPAVLLSPFGPDQTAEHARLRLLRVVRNVVNWSDRGIPLDPVPREASLPFAADNLPSAVAAH
ncbi:NAD(P)-dependent oxidoreductase [Salinactinospora qingdaonensis]|uniref:D-3-phosphoglycerate dehydrogenase n=1 Tax=Salinactinospora qingdaonensis TaxID=702744 RepID=A0ABP7EYI7_9ACTN